MVYKTLTKESWNKILSDLKENIKNYKPQKLQISTWTLVDEDIFPDEQFIHYWNNGSEDFEFIGGIEPYNKVIKRAKKLGLRVI